MTIRLNKVTRDLNVGIATVVEFLKKKGIEVDENPNTKITKEQYSLLVKEFSTDKTLRIKSERFIQERQEDKKRNKASVAIDGYESKKPTTEKKEVIETVVPEEVRPKVKPVGKIDLDNPGRKKVEEKKEEKSTPADAVKTENSENIKSNLENKKTAVADKKKEPVTKKEKPREEKAEPIKKAVKESVNVKEVKKQESKDKKSVKTSTRTTAKQEVKVAKTEVKGDGASTKKKDEVFTLGSSELKTSINVVGHIDLDAINQSTRPKKKSKEERKKEREEKDKNRANTSGTTNTKKIRKRRRITKEKVDIDKAASSNQGTQTPRPERKKFTKNKNRFKKPLQKQEVSEEDVAKQIKETLARLTSKGRNKASRYRKEKREQASVRAQQKEKQETAAEKVIQLTEFVTVSELASLMDVSVTQVISTCMTIGIMVSINQRLDAETINLVAEEFGFKTEYVSAEVSQAIEEEDDEPEDLEHRAPIVTVMGHVDHGKTSLLDSIRKANVIAGEAGGITQHIGAYHVTLPDNRKITFLDTPGHEAFTAMRARGAKVTDIAIVIVAADDNVMPQTKEAINHAMAAGVPIVFAINKVDKPTANPDKIKTELAEMNYLVEEWGGQYQSQDISAKKGTGVQELLEKVLLEAELLDLKANPDRPGTGSIIESTLDKGRGYVATMLVSNGTLRMGDIVLAGTSFGKIKAMFNERNQAIEEAGPSEPVLILGLDGAPAAGDTFHVIETEQEAREITTKRKQLQREQGIRTQKLLTLDEVGRRIALGNFQELNVIVKGDVDGSVEALSDSLIKLSTEQIQINVIHKGVGQISESDVSLAAASDAIIIGFQVRPSNMAERMAENEGVDIRKYSIIYDAIEEVKSAMEGMLEPIIKEQVTATIEVKEVFNITKVGQVAGCLVKTGKIKRSDKVRLIRDGIVIFSGQMAALKRFKDDVKEVGSNFECGISLTNFNDIKPNDIIEGYEEVEIKQKL
ncbi:translation initiation factor IF-2 [Bacteroides coprosuis DSM 18011]|uniref:Translation initiation factor IF-2 n=1 Tax=Bacteroides coprosuis DSM 18011 TaxID=679937 RepID=F3ZQC8_9BACE|nr:translation initiation factor IF-2 [Bacteroides coprosuis]EGJ70506.1 translation initiation factor IF-2 [Bacteroides coprosuis DSM 18011]HJD92638.1 translation initiation factor IF-2 [Bacteroides coprosuis]